MTQLKKHIAYTFLAVFVCTTVIAILGAIGFISISVTPLVGIFAFLVAQCITVIVAIINASNYFDDPPAVTKLKEQQEQKIQQLTASAHQATAMQQQKNQETTARLQGQVTQLTIALNQASVDHLKEKKDWLVKMQSLQNQIPKRPTPPLAPGSARTRPN